MPTYVEQQFIDSAKRVGLRIEPRADGLWRIEHVLADLRSERLASVQKIGKADSENTKIVIPAEASALMGAAQAIRSVLEAVPQAGTAS